jgi:hypothetical protein
MQVNHGFKGVNARVEVRATTGSTPSSASCIPSSAPHVTHCAEVDETLRRGGQSK